ncbi:glutathione binding-like protein [Qipengyuania sp. MTN3-11]|uniref:glutathione binding-like protein n=1 Tax=Qipengyuania sp. MTN3-11 TaxID=3056557 RepID=UPI0036F2021B
MRLTQLEAVLTEREWLVGDTFTAANLLMADVLRLSLLRERGGRPSSDAYIERITSRPAFGDARAEQIAQFEAADAERKE